MSDIGIPKARDAMRILRHAGFTVEPQRRGGHMIVRNPEGHVVWRFSMPSRRNGKQDDPAFASQLRRVLAGQNVTGGAARNLAALNSRAERQHTGRAHAEAADRDDQAR